MRLPEIQKGRECLVPEVSRTFHYGSMGAHLTNYFQANFYDHTSFNTLAHVTLADLDKYARCTFINSKFFGQSKSSKLGKQGDALEDVSPM